jgi:hypothetical protein
MFVRKSSWWWDCGDAPCTGGAMRDKYFGSHEFQRRDEEIKTSSNRNFGLVFAAFFSFLAALSIWREP